MAKLVLGIGTSHGLMRNPEQWLARGAQDGDDPRLDRALFERPRPELEPEITLDHLEQQLDACHVAIKALGDALERADIDTMLVVTNLHGVPQDDFKTIFGIYTGDKLPVEQQRRRRDGDETAPTEAARVEHPADPELAKHVLASLIKDGFDIAHMDGFREGTGVGHEVTVMHDEYLRKETSLVPFQLSRYLPNQATSKRCYALGEALRRAIDSWDSDKRVAIVASGGLSHQVVDDELDRRVIAALLEKDREQLCTLPRDRLNVAPGTAETLNWVTVGAAAHDLDMTVLDYVPTYRSLYGTGHGFCFAYWD